MFNTILWATDGSPCSDHALGTVRGLCERYGSSLRVVHVVQPLGGEHCLIADEDRVIAKLKAQVLMGSVTLRLLAITRCPVLVVPASVASTRRAATHRTGAAPAGRRQGLTIGI